MCDLGSLRRMSRHFLRDCHEVQRALPNCSRLHVSCEVADAQKNSEATNYDYRIRFFAIPPIRNRLVPPRLSQEKSLCFCVLCGSSLDLTPVRDWISALTSNTRVSSVDVTNLHESQSNARRKRPELVSYCRAILARIRATEITSRFFETPNGLITTVGRNTWRHPVAHFYQGQFRFWLNPTLKCQRATVC